MLKQVFLQMGQHTGRLQIGGQAEESSHFASEVTPDEPLLILPVPVAADTICPSLASALAFFSLP